MSQMALFPLLFSFTTTHRSIFCDLLLANATNW